MNISKKKSPLKKKIVYVTIPILVVLTGIAYAYYSTFSENETEQNTSQSSDSIDKKDQNTSGNKNTSGNSVGSISNSPGIGSESVPKLDSKTTPSPPTGVFVSNHRPNISGSPAPNSITSTCSTNPGASCYIEFIKGSEKRSLPQQRADNNGNTSWNWTLSSIGITTGVWKITAIAVNGSMTAVSNDPMDLVVAE